MRRREGGFTIVEVVIAAAILGLIVLNMSMVMKTSSAAYGTGVFKSVLEDQAELTMDRIELAVMSSSEKAISPQNAAPLSTPVLDYESSLGFQEGKLVSSDPERIQFLPTTGQVVWSQNPGLPEERSVVWSNWVPFHLEKEIANGTDDNGNGLIDETGLAFDKSGPKVNINLTLERKDSEGKVHTKTSKSVVTCRN
jgi:type II secretory pathway pseudopilin PulG